MVGWGKKSEPEQGLKPVHTEEEQAMPETKPSQVAIEASRLTNTLSGVQEEVARFLRKVQEAKDIAATGSLIKLSAPSLVSIKRASQDISYEMKRLRTLLSVSK